MKMEKIGIIRKVENSGKIIIPKKMREKLKIKEGDLIEIFFENQQIILKPSNKLLVSGKKDCHE